MESKLAPLSDGAVRSVLDGTRYKRPREQCRLGNLSKSSQERTSSVDYGSYHEPIEQGLHFS